MGSTHSDAGERSTRMALDLFVTHALLRDRVSVRFPVHGVCVAQAWHSDVDGVPPGTGGGGGGVRGLLCGDSGQCGSGRERNVANAHVYSKIVFSNIVGGMRAIIDVMDAEDMAVAPENRVYIALVDNEIAINTGDAFPMHYYRALKALWTDPNVQVCWSQAYRFALQENIP